MDHKDFRFRAGDRVWFSFCGGKLGGVVVEGAYVCEVRTLQEAKRVWLRLDLEEVKQQSPRVHFDEQGALHAQYPDGTYLSADRIRTKMDIIPAGSKYNWCPAADNAPVIGQEVLYCLSDYIYSGAELSDIVDGWQPHVVPSIVSARVHSVAKRYRIRGQYGNEPKLEPSLAELDNGALGEGYSDIDEQSIEIRTTS